MKTPTHWKSKNLLSLVLCPLGYLYNLATRLRIKFATPLNASKTVICIGNLTAGGSGKTPVAVSVAKILQSAGFSPFFISRGYGGTLQDIIVDPQKHSASEVGDEPLLLARQAPVCVNAKRFWAAQKAIENGADVIVMDDGFQNPGLVKDISFLVFDGSFGCGNGFGIPAGPMRENLKQGLKRADAIIIIGEDRHNLSTRFSDKPVFQGFITPKQTAVGNTPVIAFAGIGRPEKFYESMRTQGFNLTETIDFPDHHQYTEPELQTIIDKAAKNGAEIYTTSKDFVKIPAPLRKYFKVLEIEITWKDKQALTDFLINKI